MKQWWIYMEIVAFGESEFTLGFELAGVRSARAGKDSAREAAALLEDVKVGIIITSQRAFDALPGDVREQMLHAIRPITVVLSESESSEELRRMIIKSIGVDLWKSEDE